MANFIKAATRVPVKDLARARAWYAEKLDLRPAEERPGGLLYIVGMGEFALFESVGRADGRFTQMALEVDDLRATVDALRARGVVFEEYDEGELRTRDAIATIAGNYPSKGSGEYGAWFRDCDGNMIGLGQAIRGEGGDHG
jgi:catechol 2,3-dioxygenase-like lactoylglutathione lyase family enzyme